VTAITIGALDAVLQGAVGRQDVPFVVGMVGDRGGTLWQGAAGMANSSAEVSVDSVFRIFSATKSIGSVAALILVERGLVTLDTPVESVLPEFGDLKVLESVGPNGELTLRPPRTAATLRHLLTHTSGLSYETFNKKQMAFHVLPGSPHILHGTLAAFNYHLMFDPGDDFCYGIGIDWAGRMIEAIDGRSIDRFCQDELFDPLGMPDTTFEVDPADRHRLPDIRRRLADGSFEVIHHEAPARPEAYGMGHALFGTAPDYLRFARMVLRDGELDGYRLLGPKTVELMKTSQMGDKFVPPFKTLDPALSADVDFFPGTPMTWTAAFLRNEGDIEGRRSAGSLTWAGILNTHYWVDHQRDVAGVLMTQLAPFCDPGFLRAYDSFERATYRELLTRR
jgi:methyl acetate hydrolase